ncbi:MAG: hypothetical protein ACKVRP_12225 [Bacteroidota bacterium]
MKTIIFVLAMVSFGIGALKASSGGNQKEISAGIVIGGKDEPGEPMIVHGTVYAEDGTTPVPGIIVHVYHTDTEGNYRRKSDGPGDPRLQGTMKTNANGEYKYRTIKPGSYPSTRNPAHVHYVLSGMGYSKQYDELMFEGDPFLTERAVGDSRKLGTFGTIRPLEREEDGMLRCRKDVRLKK